MHAHAFRGAVIHGHEALEPLRQGVRDSCGGFRAGAAAGIRNRHDHGSQSKPDPYRSYLRERWEQGVHNAHKLFIRGRLATRVNITNHPTRREDLEVLVNGVLAKARERVAGRHR